MTHPGAAGSVPDAAAAGSRKPRLLLVGVVGLLGALALAGCSAQSLRSELASGGPSVIETSEGNAVDGPPTRFTIVPDDYHVPYAGTAEDGRRFFLSEELFDVSGPGYVGLFLWKPDGTFDEVQVEQVSRAEGLPPGQAGAAGAEDVVARMLTGLGSYVLEPIEVEPFTTRVDGVRFGWAVEEFEGEYSITVQPGDFIAYYEPWDGLGYDT